MNSWRNNLRILKLFRICYSLLFGVSVITLFWKKYGLDLLDIFWLQAIFAVTMVIFEIPTGYIADRLGRKRTLLLSSGIATVGWIGYAFCGSFTQFAVAEVALGLAFSLMSGTDSSLLYESLAEDGACERYTRLEGRQQSAALLAEGLAALLGGFAVTVLPLEATLIATGLASGVGLAAAFGLTEPRRQPYSHPRGTWYGMYKIARFVFLKSRIVRFAVPVLAACSVSTMLGVWLYQPLWQEKQVPVWLFGVLWAALSLPPALAGRWAHVLETRLGRTRILWFLPLPVILGYLILAFVPGYGALAGAYLVPFLRGLAQPIVGRYIHDETRSDKRATVVSIQSWVFRLGYFLLGPVIGWIGKNYGLSAAFCASATVTFVSLGLLLPPLIRRIRSETAPVLKGNFTPEARGLKTRNKSCEDIT